MENFKFIVIVAENVILRTKKSFLERSKKMRNKTKNQIIIIILGFLYGLIMLFIGLLINYSVDLLILILRAIK